MTDKDLCFRTDTLATPDAHHSGLLVKENAMFASTHGLALVKKDVCIGSDTLPPYQEHKSKNLSHGGRTGLVMNDMRYS